MLRYVEMHTHHRTQVVEVEQLRKLQMFCYVKMDGHNLLEAVEVEELGEL